MIHKLLYLLDANVLITAKNTYYAMDRVPEFWAWLAHHGGLGNVKIPEEIYDEVKDGSDELADWLKEDDISAALRLQEQVDVALVRAVIAEGYAPDLRDDELQKVGRDPFLIAYALADPEDRVVVTTEVSKPTRNRGNCHIPDVCIHFELACTDTFGLARQLDFKTSWNT